MVWQVENRSNTRFAADSYSNDGQETDKGLHTTTASAAEDHGTRIAAPIMNRGPSRPCNQNSIRPMFEFEVHVINIIILYNNIFVTWAIQAQTSKRAHSFSWFGKLSLPLYFKL